MSQGMQRVKLSLTKTDTMSQKYRAALSSHLTRLEHKQPHFVHCVSSNNSSNDDVHLNDALMS